MLNEVFFKIEPVMFISEEIKKLNRCITLSRLYSSTWFAYVLLAMNVLELGIWPVMLELAGSPSNLLSYMILVFGLGTAASFISLLLTGDIKKIKWLLVSRKTVLYLSLAGLLNYALASLFMTFGTLLLEPDISILVNRSWVLLMVPFIPVVLKEKVSRAQVISLIIGFIALYFALTGGTMIRVNYSELPYILIVLLGALSTAVSSLIIKAASVKLSAELFIFNTVSFVFFAVTYLLMKLLFGLNTVFVFNLKFLMSSLFVGLVTYFFGAYAYFYALNKLRISVVGTSLLSVPFITFAFSYLLIGEQLKPYFLVTAVILVLALVMQVIYSKGFAEVRIGLNGVKVYNIRSLLVDRGYDRSYRHVNGVNSSLLVVSNVKGSVNVEGKGCVLFDLDHVPSWLNANVLKEAVSKVKVEKWENPLICIGDMKCIRQSLKRLINSE